MRIIDADELRHSHCVECTLYPDKCLGKDCDWGSIYHIDHAPTVEAIPVEWIRKYTEENRLYQSDDFDIYINDMIADWEEREEE